MHRAFQDRLGSKSMFSHFQHFHHSRSTGLERQNSRGRPQSTVFELQSVDMKFITPFLQCLSLSVSGFHGYVFPTLNDEEKRFFSLQPEILLYPTRDFSLSNQRFFSIHLTLLLYLLEYFSSNDLENLGIRAQWLISLFLVLRADWFFGARRRKKTSLSFLFWHGEATTRKSRPFTPTLSLLLTSSFCSSFKSSCHSLRRHGFPIPWDSNQQKMMPSYENEKLDCMCG